MSDNQHIPVVEIDAEFCDDGTRFPVGIALKDIESGEIRYYGDVE